MQFLKKTNKNKKSLFPFPLKSFMIFFIILFILYLIFSEKIELIYITIFIAIESLLIVFGILSVINKKYVKPGQEKQIYLDPYIIPQSHYSLINTFNRLDKDSHIAYFEYTLIPILLAILHEKYRLKYKVPLKASNYEEVLDEKLINLIESESPYKGETSFTLNLKKEVTEIIDKIKEI